MLLTSTMRKVSSTAKNYLPQTAARREGLEQRTSYTRSSFCLGSSSAAVTGQDLLHLMPRASIIMINYLPFLPPSWVGSRC